jgi:hypothetical protein
MASTTTGTKPKTAGPKLKAAATNLNTQISAETTEGGASVEAETPIKVAPVAIRRKEIVARIAASSGVKPNLIKSVLDSVLKELGDALFAGESLNLEPLGKLSVNRQRETEKAKIVICKLRRSKVSNRPTDPNFEAAE